MRLSFTFPQQYVQQIGTLAHAHLTPGQRGKVLASFSKALYLLTSDAKLFWIASADAPMHRRALKSSAPLSGLQAGLLFHVHDQRLIIDPGFAFDMNTASVWNAPSIDQNNIVDVNEIWVCIQTLFSTIDLSQAKGFGNFIPDILRLAQDGSISPQLESSDPILARARPAALEIACACLENQISRISQIAEALIGLGAGLTPSGDDFVGGLLFCLNNLKTAYPKLNSINPSFLKPYRARTHQISFALLQDLANGYAIEPLHHIINGILSGESFELIQPSILQLTQVGHSTGWDMLAGLFTGLLIIHSNAQLNSYFQPVQNFQA
jgi:hypothetical protein